jgi:RNA polymerase sigma factor (sigma-70 family)
MTVTVPFQRLVDEYGDDVWRFLVASVGMQGAEDLWQETFLSALRAYSRSSNHTNPKSWLLTIAGRKAIDHYRATARRPIPVERTPEGVAELPERDDRVWSLVRELPEKQRLCVAYRFVVDLPYSEIARLSGISEAAARRNVHEGVKKLREVFADERS